MGPICTCNWHLHSQLGAYLPCICIGKGYWLCSKGVYVVVYPSYA